MKEEKIRINEGEKAKILSNVDAEKMKTVAKPSVFLKMTKIYNMLPPEVKNEMAWVASKAKNSRRPINMEEEYNIIIARARKKNPDLDARITKVLDG